MLVSKFFKDPEVIKTIAELERKMDSGDQKFVVHGGNRLPIDDKQLSKFGLISGQTINDVILAALSEDLSAEFIERVVEVLLPMVNDRPAKEPTNSQPCDAQKEFEGSQSGVSVNQDDARRHNIVIIKVSSGESNDAN